MKVGLKKLYNGLFFDSMGHFFVNLRLIFKNYAISLGIECGPGFDRVMTSIKPDQQRLPG